MIVRIKILALFFSSLAIASTEDFKSICLKNPSVKDFDILVENSLSKHDGPKGVRDLAVCKRLENAAQQVKSVNFISPIDDLSLLRFLPNADTIWLILTPRHSVLNIGEHPNLKSLALFGEVFVSDLGSVLKSPKLAFLTVGTKDVPKSFVDLMGLGELKQLKKILFAGVLVKNAKEVEKLKDLEFVDIRKGAKLDTKIDWKLFPSLKDLTID